MLVYSVEKRHNTLLMLIFVGLVTSVGVHDSSVLFLDESWYSRVKTKIDLNTYMISISKNCYLGACFFCKCDSVFSCFINIEEISGPLICSIDL